MDRADLIAALEKAEGPIARGSDEWNRIGALALAAGLTEEQMGALGRALEGSLDAALSLVPHGFTWLIGSGATKRNVRPWAHIDGPECGFVGEAATVAIALCIAALRAMD